MISILEITTTVVETNIWRLLDVLKEATFFLTNKGIENPRLNAEMLLAHILGLNRIDLYLRFEQPLNQTERQSYKTVLRRRVDGEPLQYIISENEFFSLSFSVCTNVLIPRPETELLVEAAIQTIKEECSESPVRCLDIGTGSGNIAIALAKNLQHA
ncbi:MAG: peptide chain release factor N(5)-glutamine methyltransferase, partial [Candidatus Heimdallarchaeota archaeon]|nr:peptide chain release factor N(5)-glutamine methyltransferase [Candidatus Heimdallarchaeota archaeon]